MLFLLHRHPVDEERKSPMVRINILALAGAIIASTITIAAVTPAAAADTATVRVSYADLDLASAEGRSALDARIGAAASKVCVATNDRDLNAIGACRTASIADAKKVVTYAFASGGSRTVAVR